MKRLLFAVLLFCSVSCFSQQKDPVEEWMEKLSVREKVAQLFIFEIYPNPDDERRAFEDSLACVYGVGGIIVMDGSVYDLVHRMNYLSSTSKVPQLFTIDAEWGAAMRFEEYLKYPKQEKLGKLPDAEKYVYKMGRNIGRELRDLGFAVNFAPVVDISPDNDWVRQNKQKTAIAPRSFGSDPQRVAALASAYLRGMEKEGVFGCGKHYPGIGDTYIDTHDEMPVINHTLPYMDSVDLVPYQRLISEGLGMIMVGHISNSNIDPSGLPMSISKPCIEGLLREHQGFEGIVITDAIVMKGVSEGRDPVEVTVQAYRSGSDILLMPVDIIGSIQAIADSVERGVFPMEELDDKVRRVLTLKAKAGILEPGYIFTQKLLHSPQIEISSPQKRYRKVVRDARRRDRRLIRRMEKAFQRSGL